MARLTSGGPPRWLFNYVQDAEPTTNLEEGQSWYDTGTDEVFVYDGTTWKKTGVVSHDNLTDVASADHHQYPVPASGLATDAVTNAKLANAAVDTAELAADAVTRAKILADAIGSAEIASGAVDEAHLSFDTATQSELDTTSTNLSNHASNATAHHSKPTSTQAVSAISGGYQVLGNKASDGDTSTEETINFVPANQTTTQFYGHESMFADGGRYYISDATYITIQKLGVRYTDGSVEWGSSTYAGHGNWGSFTVSGGEVDAFAIRCENTNSNYDGTVYLREWQPHSLAMPAHSHSI